MITRKYKFSIATVYINSEWSEVVELEFDEDASEEDIEEQVNEIYQEWVNEKNYGSWVQIGS
jgi:hypothetical protein